MLNIVLFEPQIPPNTGNIIRLCANSGAKLHLIKPLGFSLNHQKLRRAGLDYHEFADICIYDSFVSFLHNIADHKRIFAVTTKAKQNYSDLRYQKHDYLLFGSETHGLSKDVLQKIPSDRRLRIPMLANSRSLNLANAAAVVLYHALFSQQFAGLE